MPQLVETSLLDKCYTKTHNTKATIRNIRGSRSPAYFLKMKIPEHRKIFLYTEIFLFFSLYLDIRAAAQRNYKRNHSLLILRL